MRVWARLHPWSWKHWLATVGHGHPLLAALSRTMGLWRHWQTPTHPAAATTTTPRLVLPLLRRMPSMLQLPVRAAWRT